MLHGVDDSSFQGSINWGDVYRAGYLFEIAREVMGATGHDATFGNHTKNAQAAGLETLAYGFCYPKTSSATAEAQSAVTEADKVGGIHIIALDVEGAGVPSSVSRSFLTKFILDWSRFISAHGYVPMVYMNTAFIRDRVYASQLRHLHLWQAEYGVSQPTIVTGWHPTFWQHTSSGNVPGINGHVDLDIFYGTLDDLRNLKGGTSVAKRLLQLQRPYMTGSDVKEVQMEINNANVGIHLATDGVYGPNTKKGVKAFQRAEHLSVDGVVGKNTYAALAKFAHPSASQPAPSKAPTSAPPTDAKVKQLEDENAKLKKELADYKASVQKVADQLKSL